MQISADGVSEDLLHQRIDEHPERHRLFWLPIRWCYRLPTPLVLPCPRARGKDEHTMQIERGYPSRTFGQRRWGPFLHWASLLPMACAFLLGARIMGADGLIRHPRSAAESASDQPQSGPRFGACQHWLYDSCHCHIRVAPPCCKARFT